MNKSKKKIQTKHNLKKSKTHKLSDTKIPFSKKNLLNNFKNIKKIDFNKNKGIIIAGIIFIITILLFFFGPSPVGLSEEYAYASAYHKEQQDYFDQVITLAENELDGTYEEELDEEYLLSVKEDMQWMKDKENELFLSSGKIVLKQVAMIYFTNLIIQVNEDFTFELFENNKEETVNLILDKEYVPLILPEDLIEGLSSEDAQIIKNTFNDLSRKYFDYKISLIKDSYLNRSYVEAKKIIFLYE